MRAGVRSILARLAATAFAFALLAPLAVRAELESNARAEAPLRALEYTVNERVDGRHGAGTVALTITRVTAERGFTVQIREDRGTGEPSDIRADVDRTGTISTRSGETLTREAQTILYFLALGSQNLTGMDKGDEWHAEGALPDGHQQTRYTVLRSLSDGRIDLGITRAITLDSGETSSWRGTLVYDYKAIMPVSIALSGRIRSHLDDSLKTSDIAVEMKLRSDSFRKP